MSSPPEKFAISPKYGDHGSRHRPGSQFSRRRPAPSAQPAQDRTTHRESHHGGWGKQPISYGNPSFGQQGQDIPPTNCQPRQSPTQAPLTGRRPPCPGLTTPHCAGPGRIVEAGLWIFTRTRIAGSTHEDVGLIITADLILFLLFFFLCHQSHFLRRVPNLLYTFFFALYICTLHVTGVGDEMRRPSSIHAWAVEGEGSIASWHH